MRVDNLFAPGAEVPMKDVKYLLHMSNHVYEKPEEPEETEDMETHEDEIITTDIEWTNLEQKKFPLATRNIVGPKIWLCDGCGAKCEKKECNRM